MQATFIIITAILASIIRQYAVFYQRISHCQKDNLTCADIYDNHACVIILFQPTHQRAGLSAGAGKIC